MQQLAVGTFGVWGLDGWALLTDAGLCTPQTAQHMDWEGGRRVSRRAPLTLREIALGPRLTAEQVSKTRGWASCILPDRDSAEKPANTTLWTAPMRAHASCRHSRQPSACEARSEAQGSKRGQGQKGFPGTGTGWWLHGSALCSISGAVGFDMAVHQAAQPGLQQAEGLTMAAGSSASMGM